MRGEKSCMILYSGMDVRTSSAMSRIGGDPSENMGMRACFSLSQARQKHSVRNIRVEPNGCSSLVQWLAFRNMRIIMYSTFP